jgi:hypothetical protein
MNLGTSLVMLVVLTAGCGSSEPATATTPAEPPPAEHHEQAMDEHHQLTPELQAFHDQLAPRWHAEKGEARRKDSCGAIADFEAKAAAVQSAAAPAGVDAAGWQKAGADLVAAVKELETACGGSDMAAFETAFEAVHRSFHAAMELAIGEHPAK